MKITTEVTLNKGKTSKGTTTVVKTFPQLEDIITKCNYSLSQFSDGYVIKEKFLNASAIGLDFDGGYSLEDAKKDFSKFKCIISTTKSHNKKKHGVIADRFRVIVFLSEPIKDIKVFYATYKKLQERFTKLDKQCKNPSRWFYPSKNVVMVNSKGIKVKPVIPTEGTTQASPEASDYLKIGKGKLSKSTRRMLKAGIKEGERNGSTFKIAKDFQENGYTIDEAVKYITKSYTDNGTLAYDFTEAEVEAAITSAYATDPSYGPRQPFKLMPINELYKISTKTEWVVDRMLSVGGVSLWSAVPKAGKSWLARQLISDMLQKKDFLGRKTKFGEVHYYAIEEQPEVVKGSFKKLGLNNNVPLFIHVGDIFSENALKDFYEVLKERKPVLAVIDTLFDFLDVESENNYKEVKTELRRLRHIARSTGTHIMCIHHANKGNGQNYGPSGSNRTILGSTAVAGGVDSIAVIELDGNTRVLTLTGRMVKPITLRKLVWNKETWTYTLGEKLDKDNF